MKKFSQYRRVNPWASVPSIGRSDDNSPSRVEDGTGLGVGSLDFMFREGGTEIRRPGKTKKKGSSKKKRPKKKKK